MTWTFLLGAGALLAAALALLLPPLLRRSPGGGGGRRPVAGAVALSAMLVAGSAGLYAWIGTPEGLSPAGTESSPGSMEQAVSQLENRLREHPDNLDGWMLLGRSRMAMGQTSRAVSAYRRAREIAPDRPDVLVALAEAIAQASGHRLAGEPEALIEEALRRDPSHQRALWFAGIARWQAGDYEAAAGRWERLLGQLEPGSDIADSVREQLQAARLEAGIDDDTPSGEAPASTDTAAVRANVTVSVSVEDGFEDRYTPGDLVFVFARPAAGPGMPLAVKRFPAGELPTTVTLGPEDAMTAQNALTPGSEIVITARISRTGSATPEAGDLEGRTNPLIVGDTRRVTIAIDRELGRD